MNNWFWNPPPPGAWRRLLLECTVLVTLGVVLGLSVNASVLRQVLSGAGSGMVTGETLEAPLPMPVMLDEVRELLAAGALAVDARLPEAFREGHLPGAISLPLADAGSALEGFAARIARSRVLVVYCSGYGCPDSYDLAVQLIQEGFSEVRIFEGGFPEWRDADLPVEGGAP